MNQMIESKIGLVKLKRGTPDSTWRKLEEFFIKHDQFIASTSSGIMVYDVDEARKLIKRA